MNASSPRRPVDVAVGVLIGDDGRFLMTTRPPGKVFAGHWEFPGGKFEPGEGAIDALCRELTEELGVVVEEAEPWRLQPFDYPHALVRLHFCRVRRWRGALEMREGQRMAWQHLPVTVAPVLPGSLPALEALAHERGFAGPVLAG